MAAKYNEPQFFSIHFFFFFNMQRDNTLRKPASNYVPKHLLALPGREEHGKDASLLSPFICFNACFSTRMEPPCAQQLQLDSLAY